MYLITVFEKIENVNLGKLDVGKSRTVGFLKSYKNAFIVANTNYRNVNEGIYNYLVIEKIQEGLYPTVISRVVFKFNTQNNHYFEIEVPKKLSNCCSFCIG